MGRDLLHRMSLSVSSLIKYCYFGSISIVKHINLVHTVLVKGRLCYDAITNNTWITCVIQQKFYFSFVQSLLKVWLHFRAMSSMWSHPRIQLSQSQDSIIFTCGMIAAAAGEMLGHFLDNSTLPLRLELGTCTNCKGRRTVHCESDLYRTYLRLLVFQTVNFMTILLKLFL